jgi:RND superfamily putative drug exporter
MLAAIIPFATLDLLSVQVFGVGVAIAVVLDALIVRPVLLPAAVAVLGRHSWWPLSRHLPSEAVTRVMPPGPPAPTPPSSGMPVGV